MIGWNLSQGSPNYHDYKISEKSGIYFENRGPLKIRTTQWELTAFLNLTIYNQQVEEIQDVVDLSTHLCNLMGTRGFNQTNCRILNKVSTNLYQQIKNKKKLIFKSINHVDETARKRRAIPFKMISKAAQILFGLCDTLCVDKSNNNLNKLAKENTAELHLIEEQIKIIKINQIKDKLELISAEEVIEGVRNITDELQLRGYLSEHFNTLNFILQKYNLETNTLFEIVQAAKIGLIHPSLIQPDEMLRQLRDIKIWLPSGTDLPIEITNTNIQEIIQLSAITIYYSDYNLVFIVNIPLVYHHVLTLYQLISIPICTNNNCIYVKPNYKYIAISRSKELYSMYDDIDKTLCKPTRDFLLCPEIYPLHPRSVRPICEVILLQDPKEVPETCKTMQVRVEATIFHKLETKNKWIYVTTNETIVVTCNNEKKSESYNLEGVGILSLNTSCKAYAAKDILIPHKPDHEEEYLDFIPHSRLRNYQELETLPTSNTFRENHIRNNKMSDLDQVASSSAEIAAAKTEKEIISREKHIRNLHYFLMYVLVITVTMIMINHIRTRITSCPNQTIKPDEQPTASAPMEVPEPLQPHIQNAASELEISIQEEETKSSHFHSTGYSVYPRL